MSVALIVLVLLAVWRLARLIAVDEIAVPIRRPVERWAERTEGKGRRGRLAAKLAYLVTCPWCVSVWAGFPAAAIAWHFPTSGWVWVPAIALTASGMSGMLATVEAYLDARTAAAERYRASR